MEIIKKRIFTLSLLSNSKKNIIFLTILFQFISMIYFTRVVNAAAISNQTFTPSVFNNVAFGNGVFLATSSDTSSGYVYNSTDGISWSVISNNAPKFLSLVFNNGTFAAIDGSNARVYTSTDGITWTSNTIAFVPERLKVVNGKFFIWRNGSGTNTNNGSNIYVYDVKLAYSANGVNWTDTGIYSTTTVMYGMRSVTDISYGNGKYVVTGLDSTFYTSTNLSTWSTIEVAALYGYNWQYLNSISFLNGRFFCSVADGSILTSTDGVSWSKDTSWSNNRFSSGYVVNGKYILLGDFGRIYNSSSAPAGFSGWTTINTKNAMSLNNIVYGNGKYVVLGDCGITVSSDLTNCFFINPSLKSIAYDGTSNYVAVANTYGMYGSFGSTYKTSDGITWNDITSSQIPAGINAVTYGNGKFVAVTDQKTNADSSQGNSLILTSSDGTTWSTQDSGIATYLTGIAFGANTYVYVTTDGRIGYSSNGTTWTKKTINSSYVFNNVAFLNNQFIAVGYKVSNYANTGIVIVKSSDGINWSTPVVVNTSNINIKSIAYNGTNYIIAGADTSNWNVSKGVIYKSQDLAVWSSVSVDIPGINYLGSGNGGFLAVANGGKLIYSIDGGTTWQTDTFTSSFNYNGMAYDDNHFNVVGDNFSKMQVTLSNPPTVTTNLASSITSAGAILNGTVNANDSSTTVTFEYGLDANYGTSVTADQSPATGNSSTTVSKAITALTPNTTYHYRVKGVSSEGTTNGLDQTFTTLQVPAPSAPIGLTATPGDGKVDLSWTAVSGATSYKIYQGTATGVYSSSPVATVSGTTTSVTGLASGITYYFVVKASNEGGDSENSNEASAAPINVTITAGEGLGRVVTGKPAFANAKIPFYIDTESFTKNITSYSFDVIYDPTKVGTVTVDSLNGLNVLTKPTVGAPTSTADGSKEKVTVSWNGTFTGDLTTLYNTNKGMLFRLNFVVKSTFTSGDGETPIEVGTGSFTFASGSSTTSVVGNDGKIMFGIYGDVNGDGKINSLDGNVINAYINGNTNAITGEAKLLAADANGDGVKGAADDAVEISNYIQKKSSALNTLFGY